MLDDKVDKAVEIITETCWEGDIEEAKSRRLQLCDMANIKPEEILKATSAESNKIVRQTPTADENASYSSLVGSAGF